MYLCKSHRKRKAEGFDAWGILNAVSSVLSAEGGFSGTCPSLLVTQKQKAQTFSTKLLKFPPCIGLDEK